MLGPHSPSDDPMRNRQNLTHYHTPTPLYVYVWSEIDLLRNPKKQCQEVWCLSVNSVVNNSNVHCGLTENG